MSVSHRILIVAASASAVLSACTPPPPGGPGAAPGHAPAGAEALDQDHVCETKDWRSAGDCKPGQKIAFLPGQWGNEQLPVLFAAVACDLRHAVVQTNGGVACIFKPAKVDEAAPSEPHPASEAPASR